MSPEYIQYEEFISESLIKLWSYVTSSDNKMVISESLKALANYDFEVMTLKDIPYQFKQNLKLPTQYTKTPLDANKKPEDVLPYIPGKSWLRLVVV